MSNGHIKIDFITDIDKDSTTHPDNQKRFADLTTEKKKLFTKRYADVITPTKDDVDALNDLRSRPWFDASVKAKPGEIPTNKVVQEWLDDAIKQFNADVNRGSAISLLGDTPYCARIVFINGVPVVVYNQGTSGFADAVPSDYRMGTPTTLPVIRASFHIMLTFTGC